MTVGSDRSTADRILDATAVAVASRGVTKLTMSDVSSAAGVSRPTLYRYFATKDALFDALAAHEQARFDAGLRAAVASSPTPDELLDRATQFVVDFLYQNRARQLVTVEPLFVLERLRISLPIQAASLTELLGDALASTPTVLRGDTTPPELVEIIVRIAMSHYLLPHADPDALLRTLRALVGTSRRPR